MHDTSLTRIAALIRLNLTLLARDPGQLTGYTVMPLLLMTALRPLYTAFENSGHEAGTAQATAGVIVLFSLVSLNVIGHNVLNEQSWRTWDRLRSSPARGVELLVGKCVPFYVMLLAQQGVIVLYSMLVLDLHIHDPAQFAAIALSWAAAVVALGFLLAGLVRSHGQLNTINDIGAFVITILGGGLTPLAALPGWMHEVAPYSPGYWGISGFRSAFLEQPPDTAFPPVAIVTLTAVCISAWATWVISNRSGVSRVP